MRMIALAIVALAVSATAGAAHKRKHSPLFSGSNNPKENYRKTPLEKPSGHIHLRAENLGEEVDVNIIRIDLR